MGGNLKGTGWLSIKEFYENKIGSDGVQKVVRALSAEDQAALSKLVLPSTWFSYDAFVHFLLKAEEVHGTKDKTLMAEANRYAARKDFGGIYKALISFMNPNWVLKSSAMLYHAFYSEGELVVEKYDKDAKEVYVRLSDFPTVPLYHEFETTPYSEELLRMSGCKNPKGSHPKCMARGDDHCEWKFTWE